MPILKFLDITKVNASRLDLQSNCGSILQSVASFIKSAEILTLNILFKDV